MRARATRTVIAAVSVIGLSVAPAAAKEAGMPQLDFANPLTIWQVIWGAVIFVGLYVLYARWALPGVAAVMELRAARIAGDLEAASAAKDAATAAAARSAASSRQARAEAREAVNRAVEQARAEAANASRLAGDRLEAQLQAAEARIAAARASAVGALQQVATDTTAAMLDRLLTGGRLPDAAAIGSVVGDVLAARAKA